MNPASDSWSSIVSFDVEEDVGFALGDGRGFRGSDGRVVEVEPMTVVNGVGSVMTATDARPGG